MKEQLPPAEGSNRDAVKAETQQRWKHKNPTAKEETLFPYILNNNNNKKVLIHFLL